MVEQYPSDADLNALSGTTDAEQEVLFVTTGESPYYTSFYKMLHRLLDVARRAGDLRVYKDGDLTFGVRAGRYLDGDTAIDYSGSAEQSLTNNATNYIYLTADGTLAVNTTGFPVPSVTPHVPLATIVTSAGRYDIDDVTDYRGRAFISVAGSSTGNLNALDWQTSVADELDFTSAEPASPSQGDRYINTGAGSGSQTGQSVTADHIYEWNGTTWTDIAPDEGFCCMVEDRDMLVAWDGAEWIDLGTFDNIKDLTDGGNADQLHTHSTNGIENGSLTYAKLNTNVAGDGLQGGETAALAVDVSDFAGEGTEDDGSENLRVKLDGSTLARGASGIKVADGGIADTQIDAAAAIARSKLAEEALVRYQISLMQCRRIDGTALSIVPGSNNRFVIKAGGWSVGTLYLENKHVNDSETDTPILCFEFVLPPEYVAGGDVRVNVHTRFDCDVASPTTKIVDVNAFELTDAGAVGADLCTTGSQTLTDEFADYSFTITDTDLAPGDRLMVQVLEQIVAAAGAANNAWAEIGSVEMQLDIKG